MKSSEKILFVPYWIFPWEPTIFVYNTCRHQYICVWMWNVRCEGLQAYHMVEVFYTENAWKLAIVVVRDVLTKVEWKLPFDIQHWRAFRRRVGRFFPPANCCCSTHRCDCSSHFALLNFFLSHKLKRAATIFLHNEKPFTFFGSLTLFLKLGRKFKVDILSLMSVCVKQRVSHEQCAIPWKYLLEAFFPN